MRGAQAVVRRDRERNGRIDASEFLDANTVVDRRHRGAAICLGKLDAQQTKRRQLGHELDRKMLRLIPLAHVRPDFRL